MRQVSGWFSYDLGNPDKIAKALRLTLSKEDSRRRFKIFINGHLLAKFATKESDTISFYEFEYQSRATIR